MTVPSTTAASWLRHLQPAPPSAPLLVVLPHAGGSAGHYQALAGALAGRVAVAAVQYPGRQDRYREAPLTDLRELARRVADELDAEPARRLAFFGHSMGALVAFETVRLLERAGRPVDGLFVSARRAPGSAPRGIVHLRDDEGLLDEIRALGGTDERILREPELMRLYLPTVRADYRAVETYTCPPGVTVACPLTGFAGDADPRVSVADVAAWERRTTGRFTLRVFPGGHFYVHQRTAAVAEALAKALTGGGER